MKLLYPASCLIADTAKHEGSYMSYFLRRLSNCLALLSPIFRLALSYVPPMYAEVDSNQDSYEFDISGVLDPVRTDYRFLGWTSDVEEGSRLPDKVTVSISDGGSYGSRTIYAMWEYDPQEIVIPTLWDGLIELFSNPVIFLLGVVVFLGVCLFIRNRMRGY